MTIRPEKVIAASLLSLLGTAYIHHDYVKWQSLGRDVFLRAQAVRFDRYMNPPNVSIATVIGAIGLGAVYLGLYEFISALIGKLFVSKQVKD